MSKNVSTSDFLILLRKKQRVVFNTDHSIEKAKRRQFISDTENNVDLLEADLKREPHLVVEQDCKTPNERQFKVYYPSSKGGYACYVLVMDGQIRLVTIYRTTKKLQEQVYKYERAKGYR